MNGIKGYISIREASYRWGVSERRGDRGGATSIVPRGGSPVHPGSGVHGRFLKTRKSRPTRTSRGSTTIPAGQAPDRHPATLEASAKRK